MNVLSLCAGIGGMDRGITIAIPGAATVGYCERDTFAAACLVERMETKDLCSAPIWDSLESFPSQLYRRKVDLIITGFPCQPFSEAGRKQGTQDKRWLWPWIWDVVQQTEAPFLFVENTPGIVRLGLEEILKDLASGGFHAEWDMFRASDVGAPHKRERFFLLAYADGTRRQVPGGAPSHERPDGRGSQSSDQSSGSSKDVADTTDLRYHGAGKEGRRRGRSTYNGLYPSPPDDLQAWERLPVEAQPVFCRESDGLACRLDRNWTDRLRALGNAVVPEQVALAWKVLDKRRLGGV